LKAQNAEFSINDIECESAIAAPLHLVPSREEPAHAFNDVLVDATVCLARAANAVAFQYACRSRFAGDLCRDAAHAGGVAGADQAIKQAISEPVGTSDLCH
jgi:uncharacterized protein YbjT (DUF2867 family)